VTQVLNFGLAAPIDVQVEGPGANMAANLKLTYEIEHEMQKIPGIGDVRMVQVANVPDLYVQVDRTMASQVGLQQQDVANSLLISLSSSGMTQPMYWINPNNGNQYSLAVQTPDYNINSMDALMNTPVMAPGKGQPQLLSNVDPDYANTSGG